MAFSYYDAAVLFIFLALSAWAFRAAWQAQDRQKRLRRRRCLGCGYDLRETLDRCPECGAWQVPDLHVPAGALDDESLRTAWTGENLRVQMPGLDEKCYLIHRTSDEDEAELLREQLHARGIYCLVRQARGLHGVELEHPDSGDAILDVMVWTSGRDVAWEYVTILRKNRNSRD